MTAGILTLKNTDRDTMTKALQNIRGQLVDRLVAALEAAEVKGGDIRVPFLEMVIVEED